MKKLLFLFALLVLIGIDAPVKAQTVWNWGGGTNFGAKTLTMPTDGFYSFALIGGSASPLYFQNGEAFVGPQLGLSFSYVFGDGTMTPVGSGLSYTTKGILLGLTAGDGAFATAPDGGTYVSRGFIGLCAFAPSAFENVGLAITQKFNEDLNPAVTVLFVQSFDIMGGLGTFKWK